MRREKSQNTAASGESGEIQDAKAVVLSLVAAFKAYSLYPVTHSFSRKNLAKFSDDLVAFLERYEVLRLDTARNNFYCKNEIIFEGSAEENNPAYLLTRDGLEYVEFERGITSSETSTFLDILNRHRNPFEEEGGDIVTSLWQENFTNISYQEVDIFALESFQFDLGTLQAADESGTADTASESDDSASSPDEEAPKATADENRNVLIAEHGLQILDISPVEKETLAELVREEEQKNFSSDVIDILLILLVLQKNKTNFLQVLDFLSFEFFETMDRGAFHLSYKLVNNIRIIRNQSETKKPWITSLLDTFLQTLSNEERFSCISWVENEKFLKLYRHNIPALIQTLRILTPEIILPIGSLAGRLGVEESNIRNELLALIENKAGKDPEQLHLLLEKSDERTALFLAPVVNTLPAGEAADLYLRMVQHPSPEVRKVGLDGYIALEPSPDFAKLRHLLGEPDRALRDRILTYLLQAGRETAETNLIGFLTESLAIKGADQRIVFDAYRALASCASANALHFLERTLLESRLSKMFSSSNAVHKNGAAFALHALGTEEARQILQKGSQSLRPDIRLACKHAMKR